MSPKVFATSVTFASASAGPLSVFSTNTYATPEYKKLLALAIERGWGPVQNVTPGRRIDDPGLTTSKRKKVAVVEEEVAAAGSEPKKRRGPRRGPRRSPRGAGR